MTHGTVCPFCSGADPKWPEHYMVPTHYVKRLGAMFPSPRYRNLVEVVCFVCGAKWTRETGKWEKA